jgi:hypothetical protein
MSRSDSTIRRKRDIAPIMRRCTYPMPCRKSRRVSETRDSALPCCRATPQFLLPQSHTCDRTACMRHPPNRRVLLEMAGKQQAPGGGTIHPGTKGAMIMRAADPEGLGQPACLVYGGILERMFLDFRSNELLVSANCRNTSIIFMSSAFAPCFRAA